MELVSGELDTAGILLPGCRKEYWITVLAFYHIVTIIFFDFRLGKVGDGGCENGNRKATNMRNYLLYYAKVFTHPHGAVLSLHLPSRIVVCGSDSLVTLDSSLSI